MAAPLLVPPTHPNLAHAAETVLLAFALAEQARGHRGRALAMATARRPLQAEHGETVTG